MHLQGVQEGRSVQPHYCQHSWECVYNDGYDEAYLDMLLEKPKRKSHRPKKTVGGSRIQPHGDSSSGEDECEAKGGMPKGTEWTNEHSRYFAGADGESDNDCCFAGVDSSDDDE